VEYISQWKDTFQSKVAPGTHYGSVTASAAADLAPAPSGNVFREISELHIYNADTVAHDVTISLMENAEGVILYTKKSVPAGATVFYSNIAGWSVIGG
jgi:hypothetical protein